jgi:hypothetical protein
MMKSDDEDDEMEQFETALDAQVASDVRLLETFLDEDDEKQLETHLQTAHLLLETLEEEEVEDEWILPHVDTWAEWSDLLTEMNLNTTQACRDACERMYGFQATQKTKNWYVKGVCRQCDTNEYDVQFCTTFIRRRGPFCESCTKMPRERNLVNAHWQEHVAPTLRTTEEELERCTSKYNLTVSVPQGVSYANKRIVKGKCQASSCNGTYSKAFCNFIQSGPYCSICLGARGLLCDVYPGLAATMLQQSRIEQFSDEHVQLVTRTLFPNEDCTDVSVPEMREKMSGLVGLWLKYSSKSHRKVVWVCTDTCTRCNLPHLWWTEVKTRHEQGCAICAGRQTCSCVGDHEFKCRVCKKPKKLTVKAKAGKICKSCDNSRGNDSVFRIFQHLIASTKVRMASTPRKVGDLSLKQLLRKYITQGGLCYISGKIMYIRRHSDWQLSVERVDEKKGYTDANTVLIILELQSGSRLPGSPLQWTRARWDYVCSLARAYAEMTDAEKRQELAYIQGIDAEARLDQQAGWSEHGLLLKRVFGKLKFLPDPTCDMMSRRMSTARGRMLTLVSSSRANTKHRNKKLAAAGKPLMEHTIELADLLALYIKQGGRCAVSRVPLCFSGFFQVSIDRLDTTLGYTTQNIQLVIVPLNATDFSSRKRDDHEEHTGDDVFNGAAGWTPAKFQHLMAHNPRTIIPRKMTVMQALAEDVEEVVADVVEHPDDLTTLKNVIETFQRTGQYPSKEKDPRAYDFCTRFRMGDVYMSSAIRDLLRNTDPLSVRERVVLLVDVHRETGQLINTRTFLSQLRGRALHVTRGTRAILESLHPLWNLPRSHRPGMDYKLCVLTHFYQQHHRFPRPDETHQNLAVGAFFIECVAKQDTLFTSVRWTLEELDPNWHLVQ